MPLSDYVNNEAFQELSRLNKYFIEADKKLFLDLRRRKGYLEELEKLTWDDSDLTITINLKEAAKKKMRLRVNRYYQGKYLYTLSKDGLYMFYKEYGDKKQSDITT